MRKWSKYLTSAALLILGTATAASMITACSSDDSTGSSEETTDDSETTTGTNTDTTGTTDTTNTDNTTNTDGTNTTGTTTGTNTTGTNTTGTNTTGTNTSSTDTTGTNTSTTDTTGTSSTDTTGTETTETALKDDGETCQDAVECKNGYCSGFGPGGKVCGQCDSDMSCRDDMKGINCVTVTTGMPHRECSTGELGERCESDDGCKDMICQLTMQGNNTRGVCGECHDDKQCQDEMKGGACVSKDKDGVTYPQCVASAALGETCENDDSCESKICADTGRGRMHCSECRGMDSECVDSMKGLNCTSMRDMTNMSLSWLGCGMGALGENCDSDTGCAESTHCATTTGTNMVCSACSADEHCGMDETCSFKSGMGPGMTVECVAKDSQAADTVCKPGGMFDACTGFCVEVAGMTGPTGIGVCGECRPDHAEEDCGTGKTCSDPKFGMGGYTGSVCSM